MDAEGLGRASGTISAFRRSTLQTCFFAVAFTTPKEMNRDNAKSKPESRPLQCAVVIIADFLFKVLPRTIPLAPHSVCKFLSR